MSGEMLSREELLKKIEDKQKEITQLRDVIYETMKTNVLLVERLKRYEGGLNHYDCRWSFIEKIVYVLKERKRTMFASEILSNLSAKENLYWQNPTKVLSSYLRRAIEYDKIVSIHIAGHNGYLYALADWVDTDGYLYEEYK